jgi:hypothetical protein
VKKEPKPFSICGRYGSVCSEANGYMWMRIFVTIVVLATSIFVALFSKGAVEALKIPGLVSAANFLSTGFALVAVPYIASCVKCRSMRDEIKYEWDLCCSKEKYEWDLCCSKEKGAAIVTEAQVQANVQTWQRKIRATAALIPNKPKEKGAKKDAS